MVSRKRNKGKERKAKKEVIIANVRADWQRLVRGEDKNGVKLIECDHGCDTRRGLMMDTFYTYLPYRLLKIMLHYTRFVCPSLITNNSVLQNF